jgi:lysine-specific demethylase 8
MSMEIERIERPTAERFAADFASRERPVILTGVLDDWPARTTWSLAYIASKVGDSKVTVCVPPDGTPEGYYRIERSIVHHYEQIAFSEFVRRTSGGTVPALSSVGVRLPDVAAEIGSIDYPGYSPPEWLRISPKRTTTLLHYDSRQNLHALVTGRKRFVIFDQKDFSHLYPYSMFSSYPHMSRVYLPAPDLQQFPRFARATAYEITLVAGEILFLPPGWWHEVDTLAPSISVSFWGRQYGVWTRSYLHARLPSQLRKWTRRLKKARA